MSILKRKAKRLGSSFTEESLTRILGADTPFSVREAYNSFRTKLLFTGNGEKCPVYVITSANAGDGKTVNTINLAITLAQMGKRTLVIDADMRNPSIHKYFAIKSDDGLSEVLAGINQKTNIRETKTPNLFLLTAGIIPPNPADLLSSKLMDALLASARNEFDFILIDTPPAGIVSDSLMLAEKCTGYILVSHTGITMIPELRDTIGNMQQIGANIVGFVSNDVSGKSRHYGRKYGRYQYRYYYHYNYRYSAKEKE